MKQLSLIWFMFIEGMSTTFPFLYKASMSIAVTVGSGVVSIDCMAAEQLLRLVTCAHVNIIGSSENWYPI